MTMLHAAQGGFCGRRIRAIAYFGKGRKSLFYPRRGDSPVALSQVSGSQNVDRK